VPEPDVESEIYESLYGAPRRGRDEAGPGRDPIVIVDGALSAGPREMAVDGGTPPSLREAPSRRVADRLSDGLILGADALRTRSAAAALAAAVVVASALALLLPLAGSSGTVRVRLASPPLRAPSLGLAAGAGPTSTHPQTAPPVTTSASAGTGAAIVAGTTDNAAPKPVSKAHPRARHTRTTHRSAPVVRRSPPPVPIRRPTAHEQPAPKRPAVTTPAPGAAPSDQGGGAPNVTGGQPAPPD
jgi:hypothetical protein